MFLRWFPPGEQRQQITLTSCMNLFTTEHYKIQQRIDCVSIPDYDNKLKKGPVGV